jgi:hypothetical protein
MTIPPAPLPQMQDLLHALSALRFTGAPWFNGGADSAIRFYRRGSLALAAGVAAISREHGVEKFTVWVPGYFCDEALAPLRGLGTNLRFYPCQSNLTPDWDFLEREVARTAGKQVFMLVHYFGFANATREAVDFCGRHGLTLLEDAAHVLLPTPGLGVGKLVVYSPRKLLAVPAGGVLVVPQKLAGFFSELPVAPISRDTIFWGIRRLTQKTLLSLGLSWSWWWRRLPESEPVCQGPFPSPVLEACDRYTLGLLALAEPSLPEIVARRRRTYERLADCLKEFSGVHPFFPQLPRETCPYVFPLVIDQGSAQIMARLRSRGILADRWPCLPPEVQASLEEHRLALAIRDRLLLLPVHQSLSERQVDWLASELRAALAAAAKGSGS